MSDAWFLGIITRKLGLRIRVQYVNVWVGRCREEIHSAGGAKIGRESVIRGDRTVSVRRNDNRGLGK
jgi:hypothetical protein